MWFKNHGQKVSTIKKRKPWNFNQKSGSRSCADWQAYLSLQGPQGFTKHCNNVFAEAMSDWKENSESGDDDEKMPNLLTIQKSEAEKILNGPGLSEDIRAAVQAEKKRKKCESVAALDLKFVDGVSEEDKDRVRLGTTYAKYVLPSSIQSTILNTNSNIENTQPTFELVCNTLDEKTGWSAMIFIGGPHPAKKGELCSEV